MKKFLFLAAFTLLTVVSTNSANYITLGEDVRIHPRYLDGYFKVSATMVVDGMLDDWQITASYPSGVSVKLVSGIEPLDGMSVEYTDRFGNQQVYQAPLQVSAKYETIASHIGVQGYWDVDGDGWYDTYGTAKWLTGEHQMFTLNLYIDPSFREGDIVLDGTLTSGSDQRGAVLQGVRFYKVAHLWVGYMKGDVNGDGNINITDVTLLITALEREGGMAYLDEWSMAAADFNCDGVVNITDATALISTTLFNR